MVSSAHGQWTPDRRLTRNAAQSETSINFARSVAADEAGRVHIVWADQRDGNPEIYYKRSLDGGASFGPALRLTNASGGSYNPAIAVVGDWAHVVWYDERTTLAQIWQRRSVDGGLTWEPERQVTRATAGGFFCSAAAWGPNVHVVYVGADEGSPEVYYTRSSDGGATWSAPVRLSPLPDSSYTPTIEVWQSNVYVAWTDTRHFGQPPSLEEEYFRRSTDNGETFDAEIRLTEDPPERPANSCAPSLAARGSKVWISWFDFRDGNFEIYTKGSSDAGVSWSPDTRLTDTAGQSLRPSIALRGQQLFIFYWDTEGGDEEIYVVRSDDLGATWLPPERLTFSSGASLLPGAAAAASGVHVAWTDQRDGNGEVYYKRLSGESVAVANGRIAFTRLADDDPQIFTIDSAGSDERQLTFAGRSSYPAWSKDGSRILFASDRTGPNELWLMDADGANQTQLTFDTAGQNFVPDWSYDGTRIAYASAENAVGHPEIWVMNEDGTGKTRYTFTPTDPDGPTWSLHPSWSPDDAQIWYASTAGGSSQVWGMFANGMGQEQKTTGLGPNYPDANVPEFSRDGRLVFWAGFEQQFGEVWSWDIPGGSGPQQRTETVDARSSDNPAWAPDGSRILFDSSRAGTVQLFAMDADGANPTPLVVDGFGQTAWQPASVRRRIPGSRSTETTCLLEWTVLNPTNGPLLDRRGLTSAGQTCTDGDVACDYDGTADGQCTFRVALCFNNADPQIPNCTATGLTTFELLRPRPASSGANAAAILAAASSLAPGSVSASGTDGHLLTFSPAVRATDACSASFGVVVPLRSATRKGRLAVAIRAAATGSARSDRDRLVFICLP